jgi:hypothetical protein
MIQTFTQTDLILNLYETEAKTSQEIKEEAQHCSELQKDLEEYQALMHLLDASKLSPSQTAIENILKHS